MINVSIISFTEKGLELSKRIKSLAEDSAYSFKLYAKYAGFDIKKHGDTDIDMVSERIEEWTLLKQEEKCALIFIGAMGIAVRAIAKGLDNKLIDAPVVVIDELGLHAIPVVGGHIGGANELAIHIAEVIGAVPVITTATDLEQEFSVDLFAKENGLSIYNKDGIAKVSAKALEGKPIRLSIENYPPKETDVIISSDKTLKESGDILLCPRQYAVGIGCRKGTGFEDLKVLLDKVLSENNINVTSIGAIASIDLKAEEEGINKLSQYLRVPFITYTKELLEKAKGEFSESSFVQEITGIGNVCERSAMLLTGNRGTLIQKKYSENGMTIAIAKVN